MGIGFALLLVLHILLCLLIILLVLVQNDKGGGLAGAFGGMGGGAATSGSSAVTLLTRLTQGLGVAAFVVLLGLNYLSLSSSRASQTQSELKGARQGLSTALPASAALPATMEGSVPLPALSAPPESGQ